MKPVYMCEYCGTIGTKEQIKEHEETCLYNPKNESCCTCKYAKDYGIACYCSLAAHNETWTYGNYQCKDYEKGTPLKVRAV